MAMIKYIVVPMIAFLCQSSLFFFVKERYISKAINSEPAYVFLSLFIGITLFAFLAIFVLHKNNRLKYNIKIDYIVIPIITTLLATIVQNMWFFDVGLFSHKVYNELVSQAFIFYIINQVWAFSLIMLALNFFTELLIYRKK